MWRVLLVAALCSGCNGGAASSPDSSVGTARFAPMFCASGTPGDPTCPINHVDLGTAIPLSLSYVARPMDPMIEISGFVLNGGASRVDGVFMEHWCLDCAQPLETKLVAASLAIGATAPTFSLRFAQGEMLQLRFDAIR